MDEFLEAACLTADLNNDQAAEIAYAAAIEDAKRTRLTGEIQGPIVWTMGGEKTAPVNVYRDGELVDAFVRWLDD